MTDNTIHRFLFDELDIRGAFVHLGDCWRQMQAGRYYAPPVATLLGEMAAVTALIASQAKQESRLTFQLRSDGPIKLLVVDCNTDLRMRGMARAIADVKNTSASELLGAQAGGQLVLTLDLPLAREPYQSIVPLMGDSIAAIFEHYLEQSEQLPSRLFLAAGADVAACLFLQKLPQTDRRDADGWNRICQLASSVKPDELQSLDAATLLIRLFHEETVRLFEPRTAVYHCPEDREKIRNMILSLGREEAERILTEHGEFVVQDEICNREYRFEAAEIAELFAPRSLH
ncbi:MAG: Hsp33 protein [Proteobacteria bacterium]|nr:Hsp33 protein [Pseudomonadota bacterium]